MDMAIFFTIAVHAAVEASAAYPPAWMHESQSEAWLLCNLGNLEQDPSKPLASACFPGLPANRTSSTGLLLAFSGSCIHQAAHAGWA